MSNDFKNALLLCGSRKINKRPALFFEELSGEGRQIRIFSLPRRGWDLSPFEIDTTGFRRGLFFASESGIKSFTIPDIVVSFHWSLLPVAFLCKLLFGSRIIYDEHDYYELNTLEGSFLSAGLSPSLIKLFNRLFLKSFDLITCIHLKGAALKKELLRYNPNVIEIGNYPSRRWHGKTKPTEKKGPLSFVFIGGIYDVKGCALASRAFRVFREDNPEAEARLAFFGFGDPILIDQLRKEDRVTVELNVDAEKLIRYLDQNRSVGLVTYEDSPRYNLIGTNSRKLYEYLATGTPVIATKLGEIEELLKDNDIGYPIGTDITEEKLAALFESIYNNENEYNRKATNALKLISEKNMWWEAEWGKVAERMGLN